MPIDHLVLGVSDLARGATFVEQATGVRPVAGGRHSHLGTHNAILSLGPRCYLEIPAPDPTQNRLVDALALLAGLEEPRLVKWAIAGEVDRAVQLFRATVLPNAVVESGARMRPDGREIRWRQVGFLTLTRVDVPFVIEWAPGSAHPAADVTTGCSLVGVEVMSPDLASMKAVFERFDTGARLVAGPQARLEAMLDTPLGEVNLMS